MKRIVHRVIKFEREEINAIKSFLAGEITCRELGKLLKKSHQQAINITVQFVRQFYQLGILEWREGYNEKA